MLPERVRRTVEQRLGPIREARAVGGGCINPALRLELSAGPVFLKYNTRAPEGMFSAEADGLAALRAANSGLRVPAVLAMHDAGEDGCGWIGLEWLEPGRRAAGFGSRLGRGLAVLHRSRARSPAPRWGWERDGFIGPLPQANSPVGGWADFWWHCRLAPQLERARTAGRRPGGEAEWERLRSRLPEILAPAEDDGPSLLHGDLWSGNVLAVENGEAALVDPASYHGHREVDLAMSELFGGFDPDFYDAYSEVWPLRPGYADARREVYQLFFLLVHVNLFGGSYVAQTGSVLRQVLSAL